MRSLFVTAFYTAALLCGADATYAQIKDILTPKTYFARQAEIGATKAHQQYTVFPSEVVPMQIKTSDGTVLKIPIYTEVFIPRWEDKNEDGEVDISADSTANELGLLPTRSYLVLAHSTLNGSNDPTIPSVQKAYRLLAKDSTLIDLRYLQGRHEDEDLASRGLQLFAIENGQVSPSELSASIVRAVRMTLVK